MDKNQLALERAEQARALLDNPLLGRIFEDMERKYTDTWLATQAAEHSGREKLWMAIQVLRDVKKHLGIAISNGQIAKADIHRLAGLNRAA